MKKMLLSFIGIFVSLAICLLMSTKFKSYAATYGGLSLIMISGENAYCVDSCSTNYSGLVEIPSVYNGLPVTHIRDNAFSGCNSIETIIVGNNIKIIGKNAFKYCSSLNLIKMGELVQTIGENAFDGCSSLSMVSITNMENWCKIDFLTPNSNPLYYGADLFFNGKKLSDVVFPSGLTLISKYAFYNSNLTSVNIPSTVTCIQESAFYNSDMLSVVQFNDGVTKIENFAFYDCNSLESLQFSDGLISIGERAFYNCDSLLSFHLPDNLTYIGNAAFYDCDMIESIVFPDVEINIGSKAFFSCSSLSHIIIPDSVKNIGVDVFYDSAYYNSSVNWENKVLYINNYLIDSRVDISGEYYVKEGTRCIIGYAFKDCENLTSIIIPDSVIELGKASFSCCNNLTSVLLSENISCIRENTFSECNSLKTISIPRKTICVGVSAFENCNSLENISLVDGLTSIGDLAFNNCIALKEIVIPDTVKKIGSSAFKNCAMLESVRLGKQLESIESSAFFDCSVMMSISIPDSVNQVGSNAFANCKKLETLEIGTGVSWFGVDAFINCTSLKNVYIKDLAKWCEMEFEGGAMKTTMTTNPMCRAQKLYVNNELVEELVIPNGVTEILHYTFFYCPGIKSLVIPDSVKCVGAYAFYGCNYLKSVSIGDGVENIKPFAFTNCSALYSIEIGRNVKRIENSAFVGTSYYKNVGNWENNTSVLYIGDYLIDTRVANNVKFISGEYTIKKGTKCIADLAFYECKKLTGIIIPDSVTNIGDRAFYNCTSLTSVNITNLAAWCNIDFSGSYANPLYYAENLYLSHSLQKNLLIPEGVTEIKPYAFYNCKSIINIKLPKSLKKVGSDAFYGCSNIEMVAISDLTAWCNIDFGDVYANPLFCAEYFYLNSKLLTELVVPDSVTCISDYTFAGYSLLTSVTIHESVTNIGKWAFYYCESLTSITIPDSVTSIGDDAFYDCTSLKYVFYPGSSADWNKISIGSSNSKLTSSSIHYNTTEHGHSVAKNLPFFEGMEGSVEDVCPVCGYVNRSEKLVYVNEYLAGVEGKFVDVNEQSGIITVDKELTKDFEEMVVSADGYIITGVPDSQTGLYGTNSVINVFDSDWNFIKSYVFAVQGDVTGDGVCDVLDCMRVQLNVTGWICMGGAYLAAGDLNGDGVLTDEDFQSVVNKAVA